MKAAELYGLAYLGGMALLLGVTVVFIFGLLLHLQKLAGRWLVPLLVPLITLGIGLSTALSQRVLTYAHEDIRTIGVGVTAASGGVNLLRLVTATLIGLSLAVVVAQVFQRRSQLAQPGQGLFVAFCAYFLAHTVVNAALGSHPAFSHNALYLAPVFAAVYYGRHLPLPNFLRMAKLGLLALMLGSLVAMIVAPDLAVQSSYRNGWIPGLSIRLWGLGSNPNSLGPLALLLLLLEVANPERRRAWRWLLVLPALAVLMLAQSKTAWAAAAAVLPVLAWYRWGRDAQGRTHLGFVVGAVLTVAGLVAAIWIADPERVISRLAGGQVGTDVTTLTGRFEIWRAAIDAWSANPGFGYGPEAWGPLHRRAIGLPFAFSAHNQYLDSLSSAGLLGLATLLVYTTLLVVSAWRASAATRGVSAALAMLVLFRSVTEAPLEIGTVLSGDVVAHLLLFRIALEGAKRPWRQPRLAPGLAKPATA